MSGTVTILRARGRRLAKAIEADGTIIDYDSARLFDLFETPVGGLDELADLLRLLERRSDCCVVRGAIADPYRTIGVRRLIYRDPETGDKPTLADVPRQWLPVDIDGLPRPEWIDFADLIGCACIALERLPKPFREVRCVVQATAGHGLKPGIRIRLWYWLDRPVSGAELKHWLRAAPVDPAIFGAAQIIYTAAPVFALGSYDPLPARIETMPGSEMVAVPELEMLRPPPRPRDEFINRMSDRDQDGRAITGLVRSVAQAADGNRNNLLYWASRRLAERVATHAIGAEKARLLLEEAALQGGRPPNRIAATVRSGLRHGGA